MNICSIFIDRSPVYSHISTTIDGLSTIRAFGYEGMFNDQFRVMLDNHSATWFLSICAARALSVFVDWICAIYCCIVTLTLVSIPNCKFYCSINVIIMLKIS